MNIKKFSSANIIVLALVGQLWWYAAIMPQTHQHGDNTWASLGEFKAQATLVIADLKNMVETANNHIVKALTGQQVEQALHGLLAALPVAKKATYQVCVERLSPDEGVLIKRQFAVLFLRIIDLIVTLRAKDMLTHAAYTPLYQMRSNRINEKLYGLGQWLQNEYRSIFAVDPTWFFDSALGYERVLNELARLKADIEAAAFDVLAITARKRQEEQRDRFLAEREARRRKEAEQVLRLAAKRKKEHSRRRLQAERLRSRAEKKRIEKLVEQRCKKKEAQKTQELFKRMAKQIAVLQDTLERYNVEQRCKKKEAQKTQEIFKRMAKQIAVLQDTLERYNNAHTYSNKEFAKQFTALKDILHQHRVEHVRYIDKEITKCFSQRDKSLEQKNSDRLVRKNDFVAKIGINYERVKELLYGNVLAYLRKTSFSNILLDQDCKGFFERGCSR